MKMTFTLILTFNSYIHGDVLKKLKSKYNKYDSTEFSEKVTKIVVENPDANTVLELQTSILDFSDDLKSYDFNIHTELEEI
jgi:hypothetical protein